VRLVILALSSSAPPQAEFIYRVIDAVSTGYNNLKLFKPTPSAPPTAHPRVMKTANTHFEGVKPPSDEVPIGIVNPTLFGSCFVKTES